MMIRRLAVSAFALAAIFAASPASAQTIGFKVGAAFANLDMEGSESDNLTSVTGGGFVRFELGRIALQPELLYVTRGAEETDAELDATLKLKIGYIEVPVLLVLPFATGSGVSPYVYGGPNIAFKASCDVEISSDEGELSGDCGDEAPLKSTDLGATFGGGLTFPVGPGALLVEGRYTLGLTNISDAEGDDVKTRTIQVMAGYQIPLGPRM